MPSIYNIKQHGIEKCYIQLIKIVSRQNASKTDGDALRGLALQQQGFRA